MIEGSEFIVLILIGTSLGVGLKLMQHAAFGAYKRWIVLASGSCVFLTLGISTWFFVNWHDHGIWENLIQLCILVNLLAFGFGAFGFLLHRFIDQKATHDTA
ncbi:hypothetical protein HRQ87_05130 [Sulfitobacter sp. 1151]|uniref:Uncharacterized protein n=1 Tax=Parasulfitobacter algicola TaxID=2614809 RepID=A0ABX2INP9_9RHOB|nr:hypothetical protein [Sulfitobacter algicola]